MGKKVLIEQNYGGIQDYTNHFYSILPALFDDRYIRVDDKPIFLVYHPWEIPNPREFTDLWRNLAIKEGLSDIFFVGIENNHKKIAEYGMDGFTWHEPNSQARIKEPFIQRQLRQRLGYKEAPKRYDYADYVAVTLNHKLKPNQFPLVMSNWDNTPRSGKYGVVFENATPELFRRQLQKAVHLIDSRPFDEKLIFVKSWNEWAEGNYLEPDSEHGYGFLNVIKEEVIV